MAEPCSTSVLSLLLARTSLCHAHCWGTATLQCFLSFFFKCQEKKELDLSPISISEVSLPVALWCCLCTPRFQYSFLMLCLLLHME